jgi:hypothetical protein
MELARCPYLTGCIFRNIMKFRPHLLSQVCLNHYLLPCGILIWKKQIPIYFTRRVFGSMRNNMLDELIADYIGIIEAMGTYQADWFLRFVGLEDFPMVRGGEDKQLSRNTTII